MIVGDETLAKGFVEARHRLGDEDGTKPEKMIFFDLVRKRALRRPGHPEHVELLPLERLFWCHIRLSVHLLAAASENLKSFDICVFVLLSDCYLDLFLLTSNQNINKY